MPEVIETMEAYCKIERTMTRWKKLPNNKWICTSSNCSMISGQHETPPKPPKMINLPYHKLKLKNIRTWKENNQL